MESGDVEELKKQFARCEPNAVYINKFGSNIFSLSPLPREFAYWAREQGADVNFRDDYGKTPIFNQASFLDGDVQLLIDLGADVRARTGDGATPLHQAAIYGRVNAAKALLDAGAEIDAGTSGWGGCFTPLEMTLSQNRLPLNLLLEVCTLLLDRGAEITDEARRLLAKVGEGFQRSKRGIKDPEALRRQTEAMDRLYRLFGVEPAAEAPFHDGLSPIVIEEIGFHAQFQKLWDYLIPPRGRAQTAQGEAVRIAGRINDEIMRNGGGNWDQEYRKMLRIFPKYLRLGVPLAEKDVLEAERVAHLLCNGRVDGKLTEALCRCAVTWVLQNPNVIPPLEADYMR